MTSLFLLYKDFCNVTYNQRAATRLLAARYLLQSSNFSSAGRGWKLSQSDITNLFIHCKDCYMPNVTYNDLEIPPFSEEDENSVKIISRTWLINVVMTNYD